MHRTALSLAVVSAAFFVAAEAQRVSLGAGVLLSARPSEPTYNLHIDSPPFYSTRAELTLSWNDKSNNPTVITEVERSIVASNVIAVDAGAGLLWLEFNDYRPFPAILSTVVVPLPLPHTAVVAIGSTQPFQDFEWALVVKVGITLWSGR